MTGRFVLSIATLLVISVNGSTLNRSQGFRAGGGPSETPISTAAPNFPGGEIANDAPPGPFFRDFQRPFPTDSWWSGATVSNQDAVLAGPFPFQSATKNTGLMFGISDTRDFDGTSIHVNTQEDWVVGMEGLPNDINNRKALSWDTQTVCLQYIAGAGTMDTCLVPGSPYMTFTFNNAAVLISSAKGDITFEWVTQGTKGRVTHAGGTYLIYVLGGSIEFTVGQTTLTSPPGFSGTLRFAKIKEPSQEAVLDAHSGTYPTGLEMTFTVAGDESTQTWTWSTVGNAADLLILSWPHHRKALEGANFADIDYLTLKGHMKGIVGNTWVLKHRLPTITWFAPNPPQASCVPELIKTLEAEVAALTVMIPGDFYFWGGAFGRASRLALIAEQVGRTDLIDTVVSILKQSIQPWFETGHLPVAAYETGWGGFINKEGWNNTWVDFGNAYYNDHHFHYGYLLHGSAVIGKYDPAWLNEHLDFLTHVARDYGNPSPNDPHYAVTRHMDWFAGHSWASGIANGAGGRDQESSTEAVNGYYGLLLFATAINNQPLIDYSRLLVALEIAGAQAYWHLYPTVNDPDTPYPEQAFRDLVSVGNVMDSQAGAWLFWGAQKIQIAAIQILPLTPIGHETYDAAWMEQVLPYCLGEIEDPTYGDDFKSVIIAAYAKVDPQRAYSYSSNLFDWGSGNSASNQLYFVSTQQSGSDICSASSQTPEGIFNIQDVASGKFITLGGGGALTATTSADVLAAKFNLGFKPGGGTIQALSNGQFVTAGPDGNAPISATRETAGSYEVFRWVSQPDGTYQLTAMVNRALVSTSGSGELINNGVAPATFRLVATEVTAPPQIPATGVLKSVQTNMHVVATAANPQLLATANAPGEGTVWAFARVADSPDENPSYTLQSQETQQYVTGNQEGSAPLSASAPAAQAWEHFQIVPYQGANILIHIASGLAVAVQGDNTLLDNTNSISDSALWQIV